jgi:flavin reductase (DIM6/NTAB) family NADH-FMN oxidoreductase RutF
MNTASFRHILGHLPTGVTVVTAYSAGEPIGMAANSVTSLSLQPPMVLLCPAIASETWPGIRRSGSLCINVMAAHHEVLCQQFALKGIDRFAGVLWHLRTAGPALDEAVAWIECTIDAEYPGGDHTIAAASVVAIEAADDAVPLVFFRGRYGTFAGNLEAEA